MSAPEKPVPDKLTTELVDKAIAALENKLQTRFDAMDKATQLLHDNFTRVPTQMDRAITNLSEHLVGKIDLSLAKIEHQGEVADERFTRIEIQFTERDKRTEQLAIANSTAIAAALQAQKEAAGAQNENNSASISKIEAGFTKQIDSIFSLIQSMTKGSDDKISDLKTRLTVIEGRGTGRQDIWGWFLGAAGLAVAVVMAFLALKK